MAVFSYIALNPACRSGNCSCSNGNSSDCSHGSSCTSCSRTLTNSNSGGCTHGSSCGSCATNGRTLVNECNTTGANGSCSSCGSSSHLPALFEMDRGVFFFLSERLEFDRDL
ncbi:hypothetical protein I308_105756 [Cryptococcus tetragattii IND107]|uniref:Metallothionein n=1 Tax=Cryptococcus tetragattii IND107 TaxID=1296105 RepID=A0ABR3BK07_9TREE